MNKIKLQKKDIGVKTLSQVNVNYRQCGNAT